MAEAVKIDEELFALRRSKLGADHPDTIGSMNNLGAGYAALGRTVDAIELLEQVLKIRRKNMGNDHPLTLGSMTSLAGRYAEMGRTAEALKLSEEGLALSRNKLGTDHPGTLRSMNTLSIAYSNLGRTEEAIMVLEEALGIQRGKLGPDHPDTIVTMRNLAATYSDMGRAAESVKLDEEALERWRSKRGAEHPETLAIMNNLAYHYLLAGRTAEAVKLGEETLPLMRRWLGADHPTTRYSVNTLAEGYRKLGRTAEAVKLNEESLVLNRSKLGPDHPQTLGSIVALANSYVVDGRVAEVPDLAAAYKGAMEKRRSLAGLSVSDRQSFFARHANAYRTFGRLLGGLGARDSMPERLIEGFDFTDLSKARTLLENMAATHAARSANLPASEAEALTRLDAEIRSIEQVIAKLQQSPAPDAKTLQDFQARQRSLSEQYASLQERLKKAFPKYAQLLDVKLASAADARQLLAEDQVVISFALENGEILSAWILDRSGMPRFVYLEQHPGLKDSIHRLRSLSSGGARPASEGEDDKLRRSIADILFAPLLADARLGLASKSRWIVIPDGELALLPFDTLPGTGADGKARPLIETRELSIVQSWSVYVLLREREAEYAKLKRPRDLFAMGNAVYNLATHKTAAAVVRSATQVTAARGWNGGGSVSDTRAPTAPAEQHAMQTLKWNNLPGTAFEVEAVAGVFGSLADKITDGQASEAMLQSLNRAGKLAEYKYLLFSAHGYLASNPTLTSMVLSLDKPTLEADGYVTAGEWPGYNIKSDLIVLSACDTGVGKTQAGEGVMGLPYALFVAGNKNTLLTLWPVDDEVTAEFMTRFFTRLKNGESQVSALTAVKREFAAEPAYSDPRFWAAFVLYGV